MAKDRDLFRQLREAFCDEFDGHADGAEEGLDGLEDPKTRPEALRSVLRGLHSLKAGFRLLLATDPDPGLVATLRQGEVLAHDLESRVHGVERSGGDGGALKGGGFREGLEALRRLASALRVGGSPAEDRPEESPGTGGKSPSGASDPRPEGSQGGLLVRIAGVPCLLPLDVVEGVDRMAPLPGDLGRFRGNLVPLRQAAAAWGFSPPSPWDPAHRVCAVVVRGLGGSVALAVDRWEGRGRYAVRPVPPEFLFGGVCGAVILESGEVALMLALPETFP